MAREVGISKLKLYPLTRDEVGQQIQYGQGFDLPWAVNFETTTEFAEGEYYADNKIERSVKKVSKMAVSIEVSSNTPPELDAKITGKLYKNGRIATGTDTLPKEHAIAYEILMDDGNIRRRVIYKVALSRTGQTNATQEDSIEGQTYTYEGVATPLLGENGDNAFDMMMDKKEVDNYVQAGAGVIAPDVVQNHFDNFFGVRPILPGDTVNV